MSKLVVSCPAPVWVFTCSGASGEWRAVGIDGDQLAFQPGR